MKNQSKFMLEAIKLAKKASLLDEVPVGAVIVKEGKIIARGYNKREGNNSVISHAEINAILRANKKLNDWQLIDCEMYVTLEPCIMCAGAIIQSRIKKVYFGAYDPKGGAFGSLIDINEIQTLNHHVAIEGGIMEGECSKIIKEFFKNKRKK